jgi:hypothetical protein
VVPAVFKTGLAGIAFAGRFDSFPPPPIILAGRRLPCRSEASGATSTGVSDRSDQDN